MITVICIYLEGSSCLLPIRSQISTVATPVRKQQRKWNLNPCFYTQTHFNVKKHNHHFASVRFILQSFSNDLLNTTHKQLCGTLISHWTKCSGINSQWIFNTFDLHRFCAVTSPPTASCCRIEFCYTNPVCTQACRLCTSMHKLFSLCVSVEHFCTRWCST